MTQGFGSDLAAGHIYQDISAFTLRTGACKAVYHPHVKRKGGLTRSLSVEQESQLIASFQLSRGGFLVSDLMNYVLPWSYKHPYNQTALTWQSTAWGGICAGHVTAQPVPVFKRLESEEEKAAAAAGLAPPAAKQAPKPLKAPKAPKKLKVIEEAAVVTEAVVEVVTV